jgi:type VI secretion system secreted protein Hcp
MPIYMKIEGIDGPVTAKGHEKWFECSSFQFGVNRHITSAVGVGANREASRPNVSEITVTKLLDDSSPMLFQTVCYGQTKKIDIDFVRTDQQKFETYMKFTLTEAIISGYSTSSGGDRPTESLSLNFTKIELAYTGTDAKLTAKGAARAMYNLAEGVGG